MIETRLHVSGGTSLNAWQLSGAVITKKRFVSEKLFPCACSYEGKFALEQPSSTCAVGHELARAAHSCSCYGKLTHKG